MHVLLTSRGNWGKILADQCEIVFFSHLVDSLVSMMEVQNQSMLEIEKDAFEIYVYIIIIIKGICFSH